MTCIEETTPGTAQPDTAVVRHMDEKSVVPNRRSLLIRWNWKRTVVAAGVGLVVGGLVAHETHPRSAAFVASTRFEPIAEFTPPPPESLPVSSTVVEIKLPPSRSSSSVEPQASTTSDLQTLQVRNRRLEALVQALRQRESNAIRTASEDRD